MRNRRWSFRSSGALPFCTSAPQVSTDCWVWALEEPVAPPHAVPAGVAAQQDDHVAGVGALPADIFRGGGGDDRADLHALGGVAGMVNFIHNAGGKADLVAVGGIASGGGGDDLPLGQLAGDGLGHGSQRVGRAGDAHGAVDVAPPGQGVTDGAADAGGRAAEGLDLRGMVVGLVLEQQQPRLG